jgi:prepilin-type processing-associated H-X9-DG protein
VTHPSQKVMVVCCAVPAGNDAAVLNFLNTDGADVWPQGHGPGAFTVLFVDGHAAYLKWRKWLSDPLLPPDSYNDWSSLGWTDFQ